MSAAATSTFVSSRRRLFGALDAVLGFAPVPESMRREGKSPLAQPNAVAAVTATPPPVTRWLTKATFGPIWPDIVAFNALGANDDARWQAWVVQQLNPASINDSACDSRIATAGYTTLGKTVQQLWADHHSQQNNYYLRLLPMAEAECMTLARQIYSQRQLFETMVDFWHDHFSVFGWDYDGGPLFVPYDRDVIRPNVFGNFRTLLEGVCKSTTMMYYLDLYSSTRAGPNENFARELFELHTLGAENYGGVLYPDDPSLPVGTDAAGNTVRLKYVDNDVYEATSCLTGWSVKNGNWQYPAENDGTFVYRDDWHDQYNKYVLNRYFPSYQHQNDGSKLFDTLAAHPGTAHFLATKLCRRLVGDDPSPSLVNSIASLWSSTWQAPDQLKQVTQAVLLSNEFKTAWGTKVKRPAVALVSALRQLGANFTPQPDNTATWTTTEEMLSRLQATGNRLFYWPAPNGYPDKQIAWSSGGALGMTLKMLARLPEMHVSNGDNASAFLADIQGETLAAFPTASARTATAIIGWWCDRLLGQRPEPVTSQVTAFLQQNAGTNEALDLTSDSNTGGVPDRTGVWNANNLKLHYTIARLRTAVGLILCSPDYLRR